MIALTLAIALLADPTGAPSLTRATLKTEPARVVAPALQSVAVTLECTAFADGRVGDCQVLGETHPGMGFGDAAIALMRDAQVQPAAANHQFARTIQFMP
ncbi:MAG: energy transducer TonB [Alphaproteobacteria bacterium]|nr:energy transducer TonB [Alphaproteobacteria bacterium]MBU2378024.1 energy transducer TonB [Alphaproteobacteria bacterium]